MHTGTVVMHMDDPFCRCSLNTKCVHIRDTISAYLIFVAIFICVSPLNSEGFKVFALVTFAVVIDVATYVLYLSE